VLAGATTQTIKRCMSMLALLEEVGQGTLASKWACIEFGTFAGSTAAAAPNPAAVAAAVGSCSGSRQAARARS
jgi:hypothetical protein